MKTIPILAPSRRHLQAFLAANPWINPERAVAVESERDLHGHGGLVLAVPDWQHSPSIARPRAILEFINANGMQLVALEHAAYRVAENQYDGRNGNGYQPLPVVGGGTAMPPREL